MRVLKAFLFVVLVVLAAAILGGVVLVGRGFRATTVPSKWEVVVARTVRNLAIPTHERNQQSPLAATASNTSQGREAYLAQCAGCHGIDGSGKTPIGANLYPRVPDLRADPTQSLTDGDIHYIIESGVQLTGMPAWGEPHKESSADSWKLVLFIRSLRPLNRQEQSLQVATAGSAHYVGSQTCEKCHA